MADKKSVAKELLKTIITLGMGAGLGAARGGAVGLGSGVLGSMAGGGSFGGGSFGGGGFSSPQLREFVASNYPKEFAPDRTHNYKVINIPGAANFNQHGKADMATIDQAGKMQTIEEHNRTIRKYVRPGMTPRQERDAIMQGVREEQNLPQFWNESSSRRPFAVSSSAVSGIRLTPDARIEVQWKSSPQWYTFRQYQDTHEASLAAQKLLKADSIGRAVMPWQRNGMPLKIKNPGVVTWWNRENYDPAFAK